MTEWMLLAACLLLQEPSTERLLERLEDESIGVREEAARALAERGPGVVGTLRRALQANPEGELGARLRDILQRIGRERRRASFRGGAPVEGLSASLRYRDLPFRDGIVLVIEVMNVGKQATRFSPIRCCRLRRPAGSSSCGRDDAEIEVRRPFGGRSRVRPSPFHPSRGASREPVMLRPGESRVFELAVSGRRSSRRDRPILEPGRYLFRATVFSKGRSLRSNPLWLTIRD